VPPPPPPPAESVLAFVSVFGFVALPPVFVFVFVLPVTPVVLSRAETSREFEMSGVLWSPVRSREKSRDADRSATPTLPFVRSRDTSFEFDAARVVTSRERSRDLEASPSFWSASSSATIATSFSSRRMATASSVASAPSPAAEALPRKTTPVLPTTRASATNTAFTNRSMVSPLACAEPTPRKAAETSR
jgi:hypothetical protein